MTDLQAQARESVSLDDLVNRFLQWRLPESVCSDLCATERGYPNRTGTNLLNADEARQMIQHVLAGELDYRAYCERDPDHRPDGTVEALETCATMLETYGPDCFPANDKGQVHFARAMMDSTSAEIRAFLAALQSRADEVERLRAENGRLCKMTMGEWFYPPDGYESECCMYSPDAVIDYLDLEPGDHVVEVSVATSLPSIWCAVRVTADEDADERLTTTEHATEADARAALNRTGGE